MSTTTPTALSLLTDLIAMPSLTPNDANCLPTIASILEENGFNIEFINANKTTNLFAMHGKHEKTGPHLTFVGHTDVVPPGKEGWLFDPFTPTQKDGYLYGRGAQDMKGPIAAMVMAAIQYVKENPNHPGQLSFLLTSDEEVGGDDGMQYMLKILTDRGMHVDYALVGEPSCDKKLGDVIKRGRRGSLTGRLRVLGIQGHVGYPEKGKNAIHALIPFLHELQTVKFDDGYPDFPPSHMQISNIHAGTGASNVIPGSCDVVFNIRYNPATSVEKLQAQILAMLKKHDFEYEITWEFSGRAFYTPDGPFLTTVSKAIEEATGVRPEPSTKGGTSDGRFLAPLGTQVLEFGCLNDTIHQVNERIEIEELEALEKTYLSILKASFDSL